MFDRLTRWLDTFTTTIKAGYYKPATPHAIHDDSKLPRQPLVNAGFAALGLSSALISNTVIDMMIGASLIGVFAGAGLAAVTGGAIMGAVYLYSKKHGREQIAETNMAGQRVQGPRADLYALHVAQKEIISLTASFSEAVSPKVTEAEVQQIIKDTAASRARVTVHGGSRRDYEFVRPIVQFADAARPFVESPLKTLAHQHRRKPQHQAITAA